MKTFSFITFLLTLFILSSCKSDNDGWTSLYNGKDLSGWKELNGKAKYEANGDEITGTAVLNSPNSFLCTEKDYGDFFLKFEVKLDDPTNSGVQIRSESSPDYNNGRVHGYQVEIDPSDRGWSAGIYDEARRGWLYPVDLNPGARTLFKMNDWNEYRVECIGNEIRTWLNGKPVAYLIDDMTPKGFIALQVHSIGEEKALDGSQIHWRNIMIKTEDLTPSPYDSIFIVNTIPNDLSNDEKSNGWSLLWDGKTTDGWRGAFMDKFPDKGWEIKDGVLTVLESGGHEESGGGDIVTEKKYSSFDLQADFRITPGANSGIKYFVDLSYPSNGSAIGLEYQILDDERHPDAKLGVNGNRTMASLYDLIPADKEPRFINPVGEWNHARIVAFPNRHTEHWLNGRKVLEYERGSDNFKELVAKSKYAKWEDFGLQEEGNILLQDHGNSVSFRSIKIKELK